MNSAQNSQSAQNDSAQPKEAVTKLNYIATLGVPETLQTLQTTEKGLTTAQAQARLQLHGKNTIKEETRAHIIIQFLTNFRSPLVLTLLGVAAVSLITGGTLDAIIVAAMVVLSITLNFFQEYKASNAAQKLKEKLANMSLVLRDGEKKEVKNIYITVGDIIELNAGDLIPADCRVIASKDFFVNQSVLTGESFPAEKVNTPLNGETTKDTELAQLTNILYSGTSVVTGTATAVVVNIGNLTEFGKIAASLVKQEPENEFTRGVTDFSLMILKVIIFFVLFIFIVNTFFKRDLLESLLFSLAVAVGLAPEFLPMIMSVTMAKGSVNMSKKGVIVKKLAAIPTFGSLDILCTDKTGTLTEDKIKLVNYINIDGEHSEEVLRHAYINSSYQTGINNPLDTAVLEYKKIKLDKCTKVDEVPFDFDRKKMSVVVSEHNQTYMITKGAPEEVLASCKYYKIGKDLKELHPQNSAELVKQYVELSNQGFRVLALATKEIDKPKEVYKKEDECDLALIGYVAFLDPPKDGVKATLDELASMGIDVRIITGDNELVAKKICTDVGIDIKGVLLGHELKNLSDEQLSKKVENITIFARSSPGDKNRIINALKQNKHVVGYMGDGINDAPSLKTADVGISVSNAVDVAKESADIVLTKKSLHQLKDGVIEGRKTFGNTMKYIMMGISSNFGNMFSVLGAVLFLPYLPMLPIQILLNNFLYDLSQVTIPSDNVDIEFIQKPKRWNMDFIKKFMFMFGPISSVYDFITFVVLFSVFKNNAAGFQTGWFIESLATQTLVIHIIRTRHLPFIQSKPSKLLLLSTLVIVGIGWMLPYTFIGSYFGFIQPPVIVPIILAGIVVLYLTTVEIGKRVFYAKVVQL